MAMAPRRCPFFLAIFLLSLLAQPPNNASVALDSLLDGAAATATSVSIPPHASALPVGARDDAAAVRLLHVPIVLSDRIAASTTSDGSASPCRLDDTAVARHGQDTNDAPPSSPPLPRARGVLSRSAAAASPSTAAVLVDKLVLPLLAFALLPPPLAAVVAVAMSSAALSLVRAEVFDKEYWEVNQATCAVYAYDNATGTIDRDHHLTGLRGWCSRPLCVDVRVQALFRAHERFVAYHNLSHHGRWDDDSLRLYCAVQTPEDGRAPLHRTWWIKWLTLLPFADLDAAVASGDSVCYVELAHMEYREGYYIRCPTGDAYFRVWCEEYPVEEVVSAVWEHRSVTYRDTVRSRCDEYRARGVLRIVESSNPSPG